MLEPLALCPTLYSTLVPYLGDSAEVASGGQEPSSLAILQSAAVPLQSVGDAMIYGDVEFHRLFDCCRSLAGRKHVAHPTELLIRADGSLNSADSAHPSANSRTDGKSVEL